MKKYLIGAVAGAIAATSLGAFAAQSWVGVPPLLQQLLNTRAGGDMAYGQATVTCATNGNFTITHGLDGTPTFAQIDILGDDATNDVEVEAIGATTITGRCYTEADGADVTSGNLDVMYLAKLAS